MTEQAHPFTTDDIVAWHDGELPEARRQALAAHLPSCESCRRALEAARVAHRAPVHGASADA